MHDQNQSNHPPEELTQHFWQAWREQVAKTPRLAHRLLQSGRELLDRFQHFYAQLRQLPRPLRRRWQRQLGASLAGMALALALSGAPAAHAFPPAPPSARINGTECDLADAIVAANTDTATGLCAAGTSGADTIELLEDVYLYSVNSGIGASANGLPFITSEITIEGAGFTIARYGGAPQFRILNIEFNGNLTLNDTTITGGDAGPELGGGIFNGGTATLNNSTVSGNSGGGIFNVTTATLNNSTVSGNSVSSAGGGIITPFGTLTLNNSTVSGNSAAGPGGGIFTSSTVTLNNSTVSGNSASSGGGLYNGPINGYGGTITLVNSLISGNSASNGPEIFHQTDNAYYSPGVINSDNFNLIGHDGDAGSVNFTPSGSDIVPSQALAAILDTTLQNNGGDTDTHALVTGSPAVDAAPSGPATDQRGVSRPQGPAFDIGAFELEQAAGIVNARINGTDCDLIDAITAANTDTATGGCAAGTPGPDTIDLLDNVTLASVNSVGFRLAGLPEISSAITVNGNGFTIARDPGAPDFSVMIVESGGNLTLNATTISGGRANGGAGILTLGALTVNNSTVSGNYSTAIPGLGGASGIQTFIAGTATLNNSTVSGNAGDTADYGAVNGTITLNNSTVSDNNGGFVGSALTLNNSIIANQTAGLDCAVVGSITSLGYNLDSDGTCNLSAIGDISNGVANLGPLQVNAPGNTATHALLAGSQAIDAAPSGPATDQRGVARPQGCAFDIGAFEVEQSCVVNEPPVANAGPDQSVFRNDTVSVSGTWTDPDEAEDNPYTWAWDLDGDALSDDSGSANYGDTIARTTSFAVDGVATLTFTVTDSAGATSSDTVDITVVNRAPTANDQSVSTDEDTALPVTLTASDDDGDTLTYTFIDLPSNGTLSGTAPNLTYTPNPDYFGTDSFTFGVNDGLADSNIATVSITVNSVNDPAVAVDDSAVTDEDVPVTVPVQANDSAGPANENQALSTTAVTDPANGTAVINPDGSVTYTPDLDYNGPDSFTYTVCDTDGACATATVTVLVEMVNDPPTANDDGVSTDEDTPVTFDVLANDSDVDGNLNPGSVSVASGVSNGTLVHNGNGSFTYTPDANFNGSDSFTYEVCDSDGICDSATVTITVNPVNDAPVCTDVTPSVTTLWPANHQWVPVTVSGATDLEGDAITISVSSIFQDEPTNGTGDGDTSPDGQGIGSSTAEVRAERKGNGNGRFYHITVSADDGNGGTCSATVQVSVPKNQGKKGAAVDDGPLYDSTGGVGAAGVNADSSVVVNQSELIFLPLVSR